MSIGIDYFKAIQGSTGASSEKETRVREIQRTMSDGMPTSIGFCEDSTRNGEPQQFIITKTKSNKIYDIMALPGEDLFLGDIITFGNYIGIVRGINALDTIQTSMQLSLCNHKFRFQNGTSEIYERWGFLDSGVYSTTVKETEIMTEPNVQYKLFLPLDEQTKKLYKDKRFAAGTAFDKDGREILDVYRITKVDQATEVFNENHHLMLLFCISDGHNPKTDSFDERICDFISPTPPPPPVETFNATITYSGEATVRIGGSGKTFGVEYTNEAGQEVINVVTTWVLDDDAPAGVTLTNVTNSSCKVMIDDTVNDGLALTLTVRGNKNGIVAASILTFEAVGE